MFKKIEFKGLNYKDLDRYDPHDLKRDEIQSFYQTFDFFDLIKKWPEIVGPKMAPYTSPLKLKNDSLFVITKHSIYSQELSFLVEEIKGEIFKVLPRLKPIVKKLVFQTQEAFFEQKKQAEAQTKAVAPAKLHPQSPQYKILRLEAEALFGHLEDTDLRTGMINLYLQTK